MSVTQAEFVPSSKVSDIRSRIDHPIIDADGHQIELSFLVRDLLVEVADEGVGRLFDQRYQGSRPDIPGRRRAFWGTQVENALDRVSVMVPGLMAHRLDELGIDYALLYPTTGLSAIAIENAELRQALCRALNIYAAEFFAEHRQLMEPVATIPMFSPEEAIAELDHAVGELGLKAVVMSGIAPRTVRPDGTEEDWIDSLAHDSLYDYDPVWQRCLDLGVTPSFHGVGYGWGTRNSRSSYVFNHIGSFGAAQEAICRAVLLGGVARRFPGLSFSFLEGGVSWAAQLLADTIGHFEKRNKTSIQRLNPARLDIERCAELFGRFAAGRMADSLDRFVQQQERARDGARAIDPAVVDEFSAAGFESERDIVDVFARRFYFGCEADDPMNALAFDADLLPEDGRLNAMFASDIGHWDVTDMRGVLPEAWELVEHELISLADFKAFTFTNVARMFRQTNPQFFANTAVEAPAAAVDLEP